MICAASLAVLFALATDDAKAPAPPQPPTTTAAPRTDLPPLPLSRRPRAGEPKAGPEGDIADLPAKHPDAVWLPLEVGGALRLETVVQIEGKDVPVILDTGAETTTLSTAVASQIGLDSPTVTRVPLKVFDAHDQKIEGYRANVGTITIGPVRVHSVQANVIAMTQDALIGYDVLSQVDMLFALDEGLLGIFAPGKGSLTARDNVVRFNNIIHDAAGATKFGVFIPTPFDESGRDTLQFKLDTGAPHTIIETDRGHEMSLLVDKRFSADIPGLNGAVRHSEGAFSIPHVTLGRERVDVGPVLAWKGTGALSLLGNDVNLRQRMLLSPDRLELHMAPMPIRPPQRSNGPDGKPCASGACVKAAVGTAKDKPCIALAVDKAWAGKRIEALVEVLNADGDNAMAGGVYVFRADVPENGLAFCGEPAANAFEAFNIKAGAPVSLMRFHVDNDKSHCPSSLCMVFTGIVPTL